MFEPAHYTVIGVYFPRLLGLIYFFAFGAFLFQIQGLLGTKGILPIQDYLKRFEFYSPKKKYFFVPTLFWLNPSDRALMALIVFGTLLSLCLIAGFWPAITLVLLYITYLSLVSAGQDFLGFGWEGFLLETTVYAFLISLTSIPTSMVWIATNFLLFRFHFMAGAVKLQSGDPTWRDLTAIGYHYQTQPLPNTLAWYVHKLPTKFHQLSTLVMFLIEMVVPFGLFFNDAIRLWVFFAFFGLQYMIWLTGNFSFLNHLTVVFSTILLSNTYLQGILGEVPVAPSSFFIDSFATSTATILLVLQVIRFCHQLYPNRHLERILFWTTPFHLVNRYGIFAVMTTNRYEIVIEGSDDGLSWKEYSYRYKPSELTHRPRRISPYQPRIDWQAWFLPFSGYNSVGWYHKFSIHLLLGTPEVLKLIRYNPFPDKPPKFIRSLAYEYRFSSFAEKKQEGSWWKRTLIRQYGRMLSLEK